ncbi:phage major capsid protein [Cellulomonas sp. PSBB021]|uniref:phage major capsid protein n=1 Tax=Cellulomonas sp. PSBB021 TaxID=2003551 RepID=UPI000B8D49DC|nr:phage major capsid protein [Cellulomonas sp. PSBB021]ASR56293.1 phage major capsid protein [Cellulomonas sp. PSBB021]
MNPTLTELRTREQSLREEATGLLDVAERAARDLTSDESRRFDALTENLSAVRQRIADIEQRENVAQEIDATFRRLGVSAGGAGDELDYGEHLRSLALGRSNEPVNVTSTRSGTFTWQPGAEARALSKGAGTGGKVVPTTFYDQIITSMTETSGVIAAGATVLTTSTGEDLVVPRETAPPTAALVTEASAITGTDPTFDQVTFRSYKYGVLIKCSRELVEDSIPAFVAYLARQTGQALGLALGAHLINGTGTGQPEGVLSASTLGVTGPTGVTGGFGTQATAGQGTDLLNSLYASVAEPYTQSPAVGFLARNNTQNAVRNLKTSSGDLVGHQWLASSPAPWYVDPFVPTMAVDAKSVIFGDWSRYWVRIVNGIRFERSDEFLFDTDQVAFRAVLRADGHPMDASAFKYFKGGAS